MERQSRFLIFWLVFFGALSLSVAFGAAWGLAAQPTKKEPRVVYPSKTELDFDGLRIEGEVKNPGEFYFQRRPEEKFDSLVKRRKNFHREMLRDVVMSR